MATPLPPPKKQKPAPAAPPPAAAPHSKPAKPIASCMPKLPPPPPTASPVSQHKPKTFTTKDWEETGEGRKIMIYADTGMGKSTLAAMAPNAKFIGLDDGGRMLRHPLTGEKLKHVPGVENFMDLRDAIRQADLWETGMTAVVDTITLGELLGRNHVLATVKTEKGASVTSIEDYGFGKGYVFLTEHMRLLLTDCEPLVRRGVNILFLAQQGQSTVANLEGLDYMQDGPRLYVDKKGMGVRAEFCEWCDHVFRIGHPTLTVEKQTKNPHVTKGKVSGSTDRVIYTTKQLHYVAKSRPVNGVNLPEVISFETPQDDSLWQFMFGGAVAS